jgi:hypothetical protein
VELTELNPSGHSRRPLTLSVAPAQLAQRYLSDPDAGLPGVTVLRILQQARKMLVWHIEICGGLGLGGLGARQPIDVLNIRAGCLAC